MRFIPSTFQLAGQTWTVTYDQALCERDGVYGYCLRDELKIILHPPTRNVKKAVVMQAFWHEAFHAIFFTLDQKRLAKNEKLVDQCGHMVHQILTTAKR